MLASLPSIVVVMFFFFHSLCLYKKSEIIGVRIIPKKKAETAGSRILKIDNEERANSRFCALIGPGIFLKVYLFIITKN